MERKRSAIVAVGESSTIRHRHGRDRKRPPSQEGGAHRLEDDLSLLLLWCRARPHRGDSLGLYLSRSTSSRDLTPIKTVSWISWLLAQSFH